MTCENAEVSSKAAEKRLREAWRADTWVKPYLHRYGRVLALTLILGLLAFLFAGALMFTSGYMISLAATLPLTVLALHVPSLFVRIFGIGKPVLQYLERLKSHDWVLRMTSDLRRRLFIASEDAAVDARSRRRLGEALGLLTEDIGHIQDLYLRTVLPVVSAWLLYVVFIALLGMLSVPVALAMALLLALACVVAPLAALCANGARIMRLHEVKARLYDDLSDNVLGVADWVFSGRGADYRARFESFETEARLIDESLRRYNRVRDVLLQVLFGVCAVLLLAWAACAFAPQAAGGGLVGAMASFGSQNAPAYAANWIAAVVLCFFPLIEAFSPVPTAALGVATHGAAVESLNAYGAVVSSSAGKASESEEAVRSAAVRKAVSEGACGVEIEHVDFAYEGAEEMVLRDFSLSIPAGQRIAVLGRSGAGKSTLASLVRGERAPLAGSVSVGGLSVHALGDESSRLVGIVSQQPHLFNMTLRENLLLANPAAGDADMREALERVGLGALLERLPDGLSTMVDEAGKRFSGGERHRIAFARVLLSAQRVVILDEPFAGLDPATEQGLVDVMLDVLADRTLLLITHHLQGVSRFDRVVFVEDGAIVLDGAPDALERESERYRRLLAFDEGR